MLTSLPLKYNTLPTPQDAAPYLHVLVMDIQRRFPNVHWIWGGGVSFVYEVHPNIVVKVPKLGEREQFCKELKIYDIFSQHPPCPSVVQCFFYADNGIFLEYMRGVFCLLG